MTTINTYDLTTLQLFKRLANLTEVKPEELESNEFMKAYGRIKKHLYTQDKGSENLQKALNALIAFKNFMVESYKEREERTRLFNEHLAEMLSDTYKELRGTKYRVHYTLA